MLRRWSFTRRSVRLTNTHTQGQVRGRLLPPGVPLCSVGGTDGQKLTGGLRSTGVPVSAFLDGQPGPQELVETSGCAVLGLQGARSCSVHQKNLRGN